MLRKFKFSAPRALPDDEDDDSYWEKSGLYQGDIMIYETIQRNGLLDETKRWPNATVPFYIEEGDFSEDETLVILDAMREYHKHTCIRFKPYTKEDSSWITIIGSKSGCWSSVGMQGGGQVGRVSVISFEITICCNLLSGTKFDDSKLCEKGHRNA